MGIGSQGVRIMTVRVAVSPEFDAAARAICADREAWYVSLRELNTAMEKGQATGAMADALIAREADITARVEQLRRAHFPRAHRLVISMGSAITVSRTGRSTRRVWEA